MTKESDDRYFTDYLRALKAVLGGYHFTVRSTDSNKLGKKTDKHGKVLIGRHRDTKGRIWGSLEPHPQGQDGIRVIYRSSDDSQVNLCPELDDYIIYEPVFQLLHNKSERSLHPTTYRKRWTGRMMVICRLVLRDLGFYSPTVAITDNQLKYKIVLPIIRQNCAENKGALEPLEESYSELGDSPEEEQPDANDEGGAESNETTPAIEDQSGGEDTEATQPTQPQSLRGVFIPPTPSQQEPQHEDTAPTGPAAGTRRSRANFDQEHNVSPESAQKRQRFTRDQAVITSTPANQNQGKSGGGAALLVSTPVAHSQNQTRIRQAPPSGIRSTQGLNRPEGRASPASTQATQIPNSSGNQVATPANSQRRSEPQAATAPSTHVQARSRGKRTPTTTSIQTPQNTDKSKPQTRPEDHRTPLDKTTIIDKTTSMSQDSNTPARSNGLKGFVERAVEQARQEERDMADEEIARLESALREVDSVVSQQAQRIESYDQEHKTLKAQSERNARLAEKRAADAKALQERNKEMETELETLRKLKRGFIANDRDLVVEMLRSEAQGDDEVAREAYVKREFERVYGIPFHEEQTGDKRRRQTLG